jgi:hypothetical protein
MSRIRSDKLVNRSGTGAPELTYGASIPVGYGLTGAGDINVTGNVTATSFSGNLTGNATGLSGTPSITVQDATVQGNFTVNGTTTTIDTVNLVIEDKNIGIGTTTTPSNTTADGGGFTIFGGAGGGLGPGITGRGWSGGSGIVIIAYPS